MAVNVVNMTMVIETAKVWALSAATANTNNLAEVFTITPTKSMDKCVIIIHNLDTGAGGTLDYSLAAGAFWASGVALTGTVATTVMKLIFVESAKYLSAAGKFLLTLTPASGKKLLTDHAASVGFLELP